MHLEKQTLEKQRGCGNTLGLTVAQANSPTAGAILAQEATTLPASLTQHPLPVLG